MMEEFKMAEEQLKKIYGFMPNYNTYVSTWTNLITQNDAFGTPISFWKVLKAFVRGLLLQDKHPILEKIAEIDAKISKVANTKYLGAYYHRVYHQQEEIDRIIETDGKKLWSELNDILSVRGYKAKESTRANLDGFRNWKGQDKVGETPEQEPTGDEPELDEELTESEPREDGMTEKAI